MSDLGKGLEELELAISSFVSSFNLVFHHDWDMARSRMAEEDFIKDSGTFLEPSVEDEGNNWGNRGGLLNSYRELCRVMKKHDIEYEEHLGPDLEF